MAGRGGKSTSSLTREQLQSMGLGGKEINPSIQLPPPLFPPLVNKPGPPEDNMERQYKIMWKDDFVNYLKDSSYFSLSKSEKAERADTEGLQKPKEKGNFCWNLMPPELKPNFKRSVPVGSDKSAKPALVKRKKPEVSLEEKLKELEEKEKQGLVPVGASKVKAEPNDAEEEEEMEEDVQEDDEMDDENDYGNSYFDNGENFNEEDDNLDDGPVY